MIHLRLREETRHAHQRLEHRLGLVDSDITVERYGRLLERWLGFHRPWEARLAALLNDAEFFEPRRRTALLEADLAALGRVPRAVPDCPALPRLDSLAEALGGMYVTEGSTLGGQLVARHVARRFGWHGGFATAFFASRGRDVGTAWRDFCGRLQRHAGCGADDAMVGAALATFAALEDWLLSDAAES